MVLENVYTSKLGSEFGSTRSTHVHTLDSFFFFRIFMEENSSKIESLNTYCVWHPNTHTYNGSIWIQFAKIFMNNNNSNWEWPLHAFPHIHNFSSYYNEVNDFWTCSACPITMYKCKMWFSYKYTGTKIGFS